MDIPQDQYELYAQFGMASEKAQVLEVAAGNVCLMFVTLFVDKNNIPSDQREMLKGVFDDVNRRTLGNLLKIVKSTGTFDKSILDAVDLALERRNYLTHHFFRQHNFGLFTKEGRAPMLDELRDIQRILDRAHTLLHGVAATMEMIAGREGLSQEETERLLADGRRVDL